MPSKPYSRRRLGSFWRRSYWRCGIALAVSIVLHLLLFSGVQWKWPLANDAEAPIEAELALTLPPATSRPATAKTATPAAKGQHKPRNNQHPAQPSATASDSPASTSPPVAGQAPASDSVAGEAVPTDTLAATPDASAQQAPPASAPELPENQAGAAHTVDAENIESPGPPANVPSVVAMEYAVTRGEGTGTIAVTRVSYEKAGGDTYTLRSETEAKGLASLFLSGSLVQISSGNVNKQGLQPTHYSYEFGKKADKSQQADFDWQASQLTMHTSRGDSTVALPSGTQDLLSFMYQYMFVAPLDQMELSVTNGKKLSHYVYTFEGEEAVRTKLGDLRSLHIVKSTADSEEKTELWLAIDYHYLPIKIRKTEKDGKLYEQTVTRLSTK